jgi:UDP-N-acetylmuramate dehydrogenase
MVKLSAAWLIERSGMPKGTVRGQVGLSSKHCLALINRGGATARQLLGFALEVKDAVRETFGVSLVPEPRPLGFLASEIADLYGMEGGRRDAETDLR